MSIFNESGICINSEIVYIGEARINISNFDIFLEGETSEKEKYIKSQIDEVKEIIKSLDNKEISKQMNKVKYVDQRISKLLTALGAGTAVAGASVIIVSHALPTAIIIAALAALFAGIYLVYKFFSSDVDYLDNLKKTSEKLKKLARESDDEKVTALYSKAARKISVLYEKVSHKSFSKSSLEDLKSIKNTYIVADVKALGLNVDIYNRYNEYENNKELYDNAIKLFNSSLHAQGMKIFAKKFKAEYKKDPVVSSYTEDQIIKLLAPAQIYISKQYHTIVISTYEAEASIINQSENNIQNMDILLGKTIKISFWFNNKDYKTLNDVTFYVTLTSSDKAKSCES